MITVFCFCGAELTEPGGLLFSPPDGFNRVTKIHLCPDCQLAVREALDRRALGRAALDLEEPS
jgi:hypothetical protein